MIQQKIKQTRVTIDAIAQLTSALIMPFKIDIAEIPPGLTLEEFTESFKRSSMIVTSSNKPVLSEHRFGQNEILNCHNELLMAKAFLGKVLGEIGNPSPYKNDGNRKTVADIEPTADQPEKTEDWPLMPEDWGFGDEEIELPHIQKVDWLRQEIAKLPFISADESDFHDQIGVSPDSWQKIEIYLN